MGKSEKFRAIDEQCATILLSFASQKNWIVALTKNITLTGIGLIQRSYIAERPMAAVR